MADVGSIVQESLRNQYDLLRACEEKDAEIERLMAALREIVEYGNRYGIRDEGDGHALVNIARRALDGK